MKQNIEGMNLKKLKIVHCLLLMIFFTEQAAGDAVKEGIRNIEQLNEAITSDCLSLYTENEDNILNLVKIEDSFESVANLTAAQYVELTQIAEYYIEEMNSEVEDLIELSGEIFYYGSSKDKSDDKRNYRQIVDKLSENVRQVLLICRSAGRAVYIENYDDDTISRYREIVSEEEEFYRHAVNESLTDSSLFRNIGALIPMFHRFW